MKIDLLPALNGDSVLVEYVPSHYFLIDGGYVDTYKDYLCKHPTPILAV